MKKIDWKKITSSTLICISIYLLIVVLTRLEQDDLGDAIGATILPFFVTPIAVIGTTLLFIKKNRFMSILIILSAVIIFILISMPIIDQLETYFYQ